MRTAAEWYKGTADAIYQNLAFMADRKPDKVIILSGDHIYRMDYRTLIEFHREKKADLTVAALAAPREPALAGPAKPGTLGS